MELNSKANQNPNLNLSENVKESIEKKQEMLDNFKTKIDYKKDKDVEIYKRVRWSKIRHEAGDDPQKIVQLQSKYANENIDIGPFPSHMGYSELRVNLNPEQQKIMEENFKISADGKIESIKMKKKFSLLTAEHNGKDIFKGEFEGYKGKKGIKGVTYLTGDAAANACKEQNKQLLNDKSEVEQFISYFPGDSLQDKIFNFVTLFGLKKTGFWFPDNETWGNVGIGGFVGLSKVSEDSVHGISWNAGSAGLNQNGQEFPVPFLACEDCK